MARRRQSCRGAVIEAVLLLLLVLGALAFIQNGGAAWLGGQAAHGMQFGPTASPH